MAVILDFLITVLIWWIFLFVIDRILSKVTEIKWKKGLVLTLVQSVILVILVSLYNEYFK